MLRRYASALALCLLTACSSLQWPAIRPQSPDPAGTTATEPAIPASLGVYLDTMQTLSQGDAVAQAEMLRFVEQSAERAPTTTNRLRLALAHAVPGHPGSDAVQAQQELSELLAFADALLPEERALAGVNLKNVEQRLILEEEARQLREASARASAREQAETLQRLDAALAENRRLQLELQDALQKLEAITSIERSIRERDNGTNSP
jgi:hypothetical protein